MFGIDIFDRREDRQHRGEMRDQGGTSGQGQATQNPGNHNQSSFQNASWNGLSPLNRENQVHYQRGRESPQMYESEEWPESDIESARLTRKRLGSPIQANSYPTKRVKGQNEIFADQRQMGPPTARNQSFQQYSSNEFRLPPPVENPRRSSWMGPDIPNGERWGSVEGRGFGQMSQPMIPRQQNGYSIGNNPVTFNGSSGADYRRGQSAMPDSFRSSYELKGTAAMSDSRRDYQRGQVVDLTTPESKRGIRATGQTSTTSGSSTMRRVTETEPTDRENEYDSDVQEYKSARMQSYMLIGGVDRNNFTLPNRGLRARSVMPGNAYPSQFRQNYSGNQGSSFTYDSSRKSFSASSNHHNYIVPRAPEFVPNLKTEDTFSQNDQTGPNNFHRLENQSAHLQNNIGNYPESEEDDTIEDIMRKKMWTKKAKAAENASRDILSKRMDFGRSQRSASGGSSQEIETNSRGREERHGSTLSRIRGPDSSKTHKQFNLCDTGTSLNDHTSRHIDIRQTAAQRVQALEKEKAVLRRQKQAAETIIQREKRAKELQKVDALFEEAPEDEAAQDRIKKAKAADKARKYAAEEAKIVEKRDKKLQEELAAARKKHAAEEQEENAVEKKQRAEEKREQEKKREEERLQARRISAAETLRLKRVMEEEMRLEGLKKFEAEKQAAKKRAATLQSFKRTDGNKETETAEDSGNISDGGMFVPIDEPVDDELPKNQQPVAADKEVDVPGSVQNSEIAVNNSVSVGKPETVTFTEDPTSAEKPNIKGQSISTAQDSEFVAGEDDEPTSAAAPAASAAPAAPAAPAALAEKPKNIANTTPDASNVIAQAPIITGVSISAVVSDGRRRPPEMSKPRAARRTSPDPIRFTGGGRATKNAHDSDQTTSATYHGPKKPLNKAMNKEESQVLTKLQKTLKETEELKARAKADEVQRKKEWDACMKQLGSILTIQDREDIAASNSRARVQKNQNLQAEAGKDGQFPSSSRHSKRQSLTSQIDFLSTVESRAKERKKAEEDRIAKYEKDKASSRRRYDREIRTVLSGQGIELDDDKISKQVDEKMVLWEENRRKKERRESGGKDAFVSLGQPDTSAADAQQNPSLPVPQNTDDEVAKDPEAEKEQQRSKAIRAGVEFLASQNKASNEFAKASSKSRIQDFDSDESEEDPDEEPETQAVPAQPAVEASDEMVGIEMDETLNPAALDTSIIPPLPRVPEPPISKTAFLPDIVNPREEDIMHSYTVRHRAARESNTYENVIIGSFHSLEEANAFAKQKLSDFCLGPSTGKSETHTEDNLYLGQVTTNKDKDHDETVWVSRDIVYIGDTANVRHGDIKPIIVPKVFNIIQVLQGEDGIHVGSVIATASIKTLANKKAADQFLALSKPSRPRLDSMAYYNNELVPLVRQSLTKADAEDVTVEFDGCLPDTERAFSITISENDVVGPLN